MQYIHIYDYVLSESHLRLGGVAFVMFCDIFGTFLLQGQEGARAVRCCEMFYNF